jgi:hypothetical protein
MVEDISYILVKRQKIASPPKMTAFFVSDDHALAYILSKRQMIVSPPKMIASPPKMTPFFMSDNHALTANP